jgi:hypothetical protein
MTELLPGFIAAARRQTNWRSIKRSADTIVQLIPTRAFAVMASLRACPRFQTPYRRSKI